MSDFKFNCPHCKQPLEAPEDMLGTVIECPSCKGTIMLPDSSAQARPVATQPLKPVVLNKPTSPVQRRQFQCPQCGADECKKVSVVYEAGTFQGSMIGLGTDFNGDVGIGSGRTQNRSLLASRLAPPAEPSGCGVWLFLFLAICGVISIFGGAELELIDNMTIGVIWGLVVLILFLAGFIAAFSHAQKQKEYPALLQSWDRLWVCLKCGHIWSNP